MSQKIPAIKKWTLDEEETVIRLVTDGFSVTEIACLIDRTRDSVKQKISSLGLEAKTKPRSGHGKYTEQQILEAARIWNEGLLSSSEIAIEVGILDASFRKIRQQRPELFARRETVTLAKREQQQPSPETVEIQYEFTEYDMPSNALNIPFKCLEVGRCSWLDGGFWAESGPETNCCGLPVVDRRGRGLVKSYCRFHYEVSIVKE